MKQSVLTLVQGVLNEMSSDNVNSIDDTTESMQVAQMLSDVFYEIVSSRTWETHQELIALDSSSDSEKPNYMRVPDAVQEMEWFRYNNIQAGQTRNQWRTITYLSPAEFLKQTSNYNNDEANVTVVTDFNGTPISIRNDIDPRYWTSFDDDYVVTDAYNSAVETTLQSSKSQAYVRREPTMTLVDDFVVDLPTEAFSLLKIVLKSRAFENVKQKDSRTISMEEQRQRNRMSRKSFRLEGGVKYRNFGRTRGRARNPTFAQDRE